jgi:hypothetical protein
MTLVIRRAEHRDTQTDNSPDRTEKGQAGHRFRRIGDAWKISAKQVNLLECDQCIRNPSIIL